MTSLRYDNAHVSQSRRQYSSLTEQCRDIITFAYQSRVYIGKNHVVIFIAVIVAIFTPNASSILLSRFCEFLSARYLCPVSSRGKQTSDTSRPLRLKRVNTKQHRANVKNRKLNCAFTSLAAFYREPSGPSVVKLSLQTNERAIESRHATQIRETL